MFTILLLTEYSAIVLNIEFKLWGDKTCRCNKAEWKAERNGTENENLKPLVSNAV